MGRLTRATPRSRRTAAGSSTRCRRWTPRRRSRGARSGFATSTGATTASSSGARRPLVARRPVVRLHSPAGRGGRDLRRADRRDGGPPTRHGSCAGHRRTHVVARRTQPRVHHRLRPGRSGRERAAARSAESARDPAARLQARRPRVRRRPAPARVRGRRPKRRAPPRHDRAGRPRLAAMVARLGPARRPGWKGRARRLTALRGRSRIE